MRLKLTIDVPTSADQDESLRQLLGSALIERGVTVVTAAGYNIDVELLDVERVA